MNIVLYCFLTQGDRGIQGFDGPIGLRGEKGSFGNDGPVGPQGINGAPVSYIIN